MPCSCASLPADREWKREEYATEIPRAIVCTCYVSIGGCPGTTKDGSCGYRSPGGYTAESGACLTMLSADGVVASQAGDGRLTSPPTRDREAAHRQLTSAVGAL